MKNLLKNLEKALFKMKELFPHEMSKVEIDLNAKQSCVGIGKRDGLVVQKLSLSLNKDAFYEYMFLALKTLGYSDEESSFQTWMLILHHEMGHIELNEKCLEKGLDPRSEMFSCMAAGVERARKYSSSVAMESAIEGFCDLKMMEYAKNNFEKDFEKIGFFLADFRKEQSALVPSNEDEYRTEAAIRRFIENPEIERGVLINEIFESHPDSIRIFMNFAKMTLKKIFNSDEDFENFLFASVPRMRERLEKRRFQEIENKCSFSEKKPLSPGRKT